MSETNLTAEELETKILRQLKEDTSGSEAFPSALIYDTMNEIYEEVFNQPFKQINIRTAEYEFNTVADTALNGALSAGDTTITLDDSSLFGASGRILIDNEFIDFTANDLSTDLTVAAGELKQDHDDDSTVRLCYSLPTGIDNEKDQYLNIQGVPYDRIDVSELLDVYSAGAFEYAIFEDYLILPIHNSAERAILIYTPAITRMTTGTDIPSLIPNSMRVPLIVNGSVGKLMMLDNQSGYELYYRPPSHRGDRGGGQFYDAVRKFYATHGRKSDQRNNRNRPSVWH